LLTACKQDQDGTSRSCTQAVSKPVWHIPLLCVQWKTPDDGQRNCPKHVEFHFKNKLEKSVHLVGFIIRNLSWCMVTWTSNTYALVHILLTSCQPCHQRDECSGYETADPHRYQSLDHPLRSTPSYSACTSGQWLQQWGPLWHHLAAETQHKNLIQNFTGCDTYHSANESSEKYSSCTRGNCTP